MNRKVDRPVRPSDFVVVFAGLLHNLTQTAEVFTGELLDLAIYHSKQKSDTHKAWQEMAADLEKIQEETDG